MERAMPHSSSPFFCGVMRSNVGGNLPSTALDSLGDLAELDTINNTNWSGEVLAVENGGTGQSESGLWQFSKSEMRGLAPEFTPFGAIELVFPPYDEIEIDIYSISSSGVRNGDSLVCHLGGDGIAPAGGDFFTDHYRWSLHRILDLASGSHYGSTRDTSITLDKDIRGSDMLFAIYGYFCGRILISNCKGLGLGTVFIPRVTWEGSNTNSPNNFIRMVGGAFIAQYDDAGSPAGPITKLNFSHEDASGTTVPASFTSFNAVVRGRNYPTV